jgi:signal transduction histidine kinase
VSDLRRSGGGLSGGEGRTRARRAAVVLLAAAGAASGVAAVLAGRADPGWWFAGESAAAAVLELAAGLALLAAGGAASWRRPDSAFGPLLALAGVAWFLPEWNNPDAGESFTFTIALAFGAAAPPLIAHAALAYPAGRLRSRAERAAVAAAYLACVGLAGLLPALLVDPPALGCGDCPDNLLLVTGDSGLAAELQRLGLRLGAFSAALVVALAAWRTARASVAERLLTAPVIAAACVYLLAAAAQLAHASDRGFLENDVLWLWAAQGVALILLALASGLQWARSRRTRSALAALVVELEHSPAPGGLQAALARRLGDPSLEILHRLPDGRLVDAAGRPTAPPPDRELTPLVSAGRTLAVLAHRPGLIADPAVPEAVVSGARLALDNQRLHAELRAQLEDLRASRARIVEAADGERRRLERDLHDGAQQRLVALSLAIGLAMAERGDGDPRLQEAHTQVNALLADLRTLAHGIYPVALAEEGLEAAIEALAEGSAVPLRLEANLPRERLEPPVEAAAYLVVREMARDERRGWASVAVSDAGGRLVLDVAAEGDAPAELQHLEDRVGAVGGDLRTETTAAGVTRLRAQLPCA